MQRKLQASSHCLRVWDKITPILEKPLVIGTLLTCFDFDGYPHASQSSLGSGFAKPHAAMQWLWFCRRLQLFRAVLCYSLMWDLAALLLTGQDSQDTYGPDSEKQLSTYLTRTGAREGHACVPVMYVGIKHAFKRFSGT